MPGGGVAAHDHAVNFYDDDVEAVASIARYVAEGLNNGERVVVLATPAHRRALDLILEQTIDLAWARGAARYIAFDAAGTLDTFMADGSPDRDRFMACIGGIVAAARADGSTVRAFGEMVALLWDEGNVTGAIELESLWNELAQHYPFSLLCAYHTSAFDDARLVDIGLVCDLHTAVVGPSSYDSEPTSPAVVVGDLHSEVFLPVPEAVPALRRFVTSALEGWGEGRLVWDATLIASEMATNAVRHGESPFRAVISRDTSVVRIGVEDVGPGWPAHRNARLDDLDGRGVAIVEALSDRWGCDKSPDGKVTWAELGSRYAEDVRLAE